MAQPGPTRVAEKTEEFLLLPCPFILVFPSPTDARILSRCFHLRDSFIPGVLLVLEPKSTVAKVKIHRREKAEAGGAPEPHLCLWQLPGCTSSCPHRPPELSCALSCMVPTPGWVWGPQVTVQISPPPHTYTSMYSLRHMFHTHAHTHVSICSHMFRTHAHIVLTQDIREPTLVHFEGHFATSPTL